MSAKHVLITGGSSGIGLSIARKLHAQGVTVHITGRNEHSLEKVRKELGSKVFTHCGDISKSAHRIELMTQVKAHCSGALDGLVINAASYGYRMLLETDLSEVEQYFQTNTISAFHLVKLAHPLLCAGSGKSVLMISSTLGARPVPGTGIYAATKAALNSLTQAFALELAQDKIRVNAVLPGVVDTPIHEPDGPGAPSKEEKLAMLGPMHPIGRIGRADEVADAALFLLSDQNSWITGSLFFVDGGISLV